MTLTAAEFAREDAVAKVSSKLTEEQTIDGIIAVGEAACERPEITTDDVDFDLPAGVDPRAWVALMRGAAREGFIEKTDRTRNSRSVKCHARPKTIWRSLIYDGTPL